ncbi:unnamed protein product [Candida verbasci]|uniref:Acid phosphatase n=1 Tax=Candida verbasci TaxID=1227364 RepID=A0A9W4X9L6_9ASCO|nr:unnamed protein product [Candida verbasci]
MVAISHISSLLLVGQDQYRGLGSPQQAAVDNYLIPRFLGGASPYTQHPGYGISTETPEGCTVEQVQLFARHGARYPTESSSGEMLAVLEKIRALNVTIEGPLSWLNDYEFFALDEQYYGLETTPQNSVGPYSGLEDAYNLGFNFRSKYKHLYESGQVFPVFTSNGERVYETAENFARGFLNEEYSSETVKYNIFAEALEAGLNSATVLDACPAYTEDEFEEAIAQVDTTWIIDLGKRLLAAHPEIELDVDEVLILFDWCSYETNVRGSSQMCNVFTSEDFIRYNYYDDIEQYYTASYGNSMSKTIGSVPVLAGLKLFKEKNNTNKIWVQFTHSTDVDLYAAALGLFEPEAHLPLDRIVFDRSYSHGNLVPMGARYTAELLRDCNGQKYVRHIVNDAVIPLKTCYSGPGFSCPLEDYEAYLMERLGDKNFIEECETPADVPQELTFFWDWETTEYWAELEV